MLTVIVVMSLGILLGYVLRRRTRLLKGAERAVTLTIYLLLFLLGLAVGKNDIILRNIHRIGIDALAITLAAVAGSVLLCWLVYRLFFRKRSAL